MAGYGKREKKSEGVRTNIYVVALALEDETGRTSVLMTFDLVKIGRDWGKVITDRCQKDFGLTRDHIVLNASHSHSGPVTGNASPFYLPMRSADVEVERRYTHEEVWQFGDGLKFIALSGEVVVDYALRLKAQYGWDTTWVAGCSNDVFGYTPSLRVLREGGYEGGDANKDLGGPFGAPVEEIIVEKVGDLGFVKK
jgi:hypothetical protein